MKKLLVISFLVFTAAASGRELVSAQDSEGIYCPQCNTEIFIPNKLNQQLAAISDAVTTDIVKRVFKERRGKDAGSNHMSVATFKGLYNKITKKPLEDISTIQSHLDVSGKYVFIDEPAKRVGDLITTIMDHTSQAAFRDYLKYKATHQAYLEQVRKNLPPNAGYETITINRVQ